MDTQKAAAPRITSLWTSVAAVIVTVGGGGGKPHLVAS